MSFHVAFSAFIQYIILMDVIWGKGEKRKRMMALHTFLKNAEMLGAEE